MTVGELLVSPSYWVAFGTCFVAGWCVKGDVYGALVYGTFAPPALFLVNVIVTFAISIPAFVLSKLAPQVWRASCEAFFSLPELLQFVLNPSFLVTAGSFAIFCCSAREVSEPLAGKGSSKSSGRPHLFRPKVP